MRSRLLMLTLALFPLATAGAKKKPKPAPKPAAAAAAPAPAAKANEKAVNELLGPWKWGMSVDDVLVALNKQLMDRLAPDLAKTTDVYEQIRLKKQVKTEVDAVRDSQIKFEGQRTGWDVSIIEGEFMQKNGESMMLYRENDPATGRDQQRFFFFKDGKLWKQFIAFNMEPYKGKTFNDFREAMEARYGKGTPITKTERDGKEKLVSVAWKSGSTYLRAIDLMQFYSNFCLAFSDDNVEKAMAAERLARAPKVAPRGTVTDAPSNEKVNDPNADVIDRIIANPSPTAPPSDKPQQKAEEKKQ
jgi:hypothetical protein